MASILAYPVEHDDAALILELQLQDIDNAIASAKGKSRVGEVNDYDYALGLLQQELEEQNSVEHDRVYARSMARAIQMDHHIISKEIEAEESAARDRKMASELEGGAASSAVPGIYELSSDAQVLDTDYYAKIAALHISETYGAFLLDHEPESVAESSSMGARLGSKKPPKLRVCISCREEKSFFNMAGLPCAHEYCRDCLDVLFEASMSDESLYPPRCCRQPIPFESFRVFLSPALAKKFAKKIPELQTSNRTYCSNIECTEWIHPINISADIAICPGCKTGTCTTCKGAAHLGDCPQDEALNQLLETARENHWQRCYQCKRVVDLNHGCNHMSCRCGAQFCYVCGEPWKNCACEHWEEYRLYARAEELLAREGHRPQALPYRPAAEDAPGNGPVVQDQPRDEPLAAALQVNEPNNGEVVGPPLPNIEVPAIATMGRLAAMVDHLRTNHDCGHLKWRYVSGQHRCEECSHVLPQYIFECRQCNIRACNRCRRNRL